MENQISFPIAYRVGCKQRWKGVSGTNESRRTICIDAPRCGYSISGKALKKPLRFGGRGKHFYLQMAVCGVFEKTRVLASPPMIGGCDPPQDRIPAQKRFAECFPVARPHLLPGKNAL